MEGLAQIAPPQLETIGRSVLEDFLRLPVTGSDLHAADNSSCGALVSISGAWDGVVEIRVSEAMARRIGAAMFHCDVSRVDDDKLRDALDEVANIVAGNVKALLPAPSRLSMPSFCVGGSARPAADSAIRLLDQHGDYLWIGVTALGAV
jgi:CheY-specific phosphatase CheX